MSFNRQVLLVEDDITTARMIHDILNRSGFQVTSAYDGETGLNLFKKIKFSVVLVDLNIPMMNGDKLIDEIKKIDRNATVIVQSANSDQSMIISVMKKGVYDYIIKPIDFKKLPEKIKKACEHSDLVFVQQQKENEEKNRIQEEINWIKWKHDRSNSDDFKSVKKETSLFYFLKTYFSQGAGIGVLISMIKMLLYRPTIEDGRFSIGEDVMELLRDNLIIVDKIINMFNELDDIISNEIQVEKVSYEDIYTIISNTVTESEKYRSFNNNTISLSSLNPGFSEFNANLNKEFFHRCVYELIMNALKFSVPGSTITLLFNVTESSRCELMVINTPNTTNWGSVPDNFDTIIFDPFYRMTNAVYEAYHTLDYGLGLTYVDKVIRKQGGTITVSRIKDYTDFSSNPKIKLSFNLSLPAFR